MTIAKDPTVVRDPPATAKCTVLSASSDTAQSTTSTSFVATDTSVAVTLASDAAVVALAAAVVYTGTTTEGTMRIRIAAYSADGSLVAYCAVPVRTSSSYYRTVCVPLICMLAKGTYTVRIEFAAPSDVATTGYINNKRLFVLVIPS
jgi:hypothetical protein